MKRISALKKIIAKTIIALIIFSIFASLSYMIYLMGGWPCIGVVVGTMGIIYAFVWALDVLENTK